MRRARRSGLALVGFATALGCAPTASQTDAPWPPSGTISPGVPTEVAGQNTPAVADEQTEAGTVVALRDLLVHVDNVSGTRIAVSFFGVPAESGRTVVIRLSAYDPAADPNFYGCEQLTLSVDSAQLQMSLRNVGIVAPEAGGRLVRLEHTLDPSEFERVLAAHEIHGLFCDRTTVSFGVETLSHVHEFGRRLAASASIDPDATRVANDPPQATPGSTSPAVPSTGPVYVHGYYRRDGTYVHPHTRSRPRR